MYSNVIREREELSEQIRALQELKKLGEIYGYDISRPAKDTKEAIQWLYFGYLAAVKEQNGAAMSLGRTSTFIDIYAQRDLDNGVYTEEEIQEFIDHFIMKLRLVKFARTPEYNELFSGDPDLGHGIDRRGRHRRPASGHQVFLPLPPYLKESGHGAGTELDGAVVDAAAAELQAVLRQNLDRVLCRSSMKTTI